VFSDSIRDNLFARRGKREKSMAANTRTTTTTVDQKEN
jgi:hypothetical protein